MAKRMVVVSKDMSMTRDWGRNIRALGRLPWEKHDSNITNALKFNHGI